MKGKSNQLIAIIGIAIISISQFSFAQKSVLSKKEVKTTIDSLSVIINMHHIDKNVAEEMVNTLYTYFEDGRYDTINSKTSFAKTIESDLSTIVNDKHFHFFYDPENAKKSGESGVNELLNTMLGNPHDNFGFQEVTILPGNIGYWKFDLLPYPHDAGNIASAALTFLSNTDALIIDLTENRGGYNEMLQYILSCFFRYPTHINTLYTRYTNEYQQFWTSPYTSGKILDSLDIYVLTSRVTFSAGEWFAYALQEYDRAKIIGETTKGGATPTDFFYIMDEYIMMLPNTSCVSPVSDTHFNNTGVKPDVTCTASQAKDIAYELAVMKLDSAMTDQSLKMEYKWILDGINAKIRPAMISENDLKSIPGKYGRSTIRKIDESLFFYSYNGNKYEMLPINEVYFVLDGLDALRIKIVKEQDLITGIEAVYSNGYKNTIPRAK